MEGYRLFKDPLEGYFIERLNRFVVSCRVGGRQTKAYLPNPGRLWELLLPGATLIVEPTGSASGLPYRVVGVMKGGMPVMLHTHRTNDVAAALIGEGLVPRLKGYRVVAREVRHGHSRFDMLLEADGGRALMVEVKSVTLFSGRLAMFPDAPTTRGLKHIRGLSSLGGGVEGAVLFVAFSEGVEYFLPEFHVDPAFARELAGLRHRLKVLPIAIGLTKDGRIKLPVRELKIPWHILEQEPQDGGIFMVVFRADRPVVVATGSSRRELQSGYYTYVGSARSGLYSPVARHIRRQKRGLLWQIDRLRAQTKLVRTIPIRTTEPLECGLARSCSAILAPIEGVGTPECGCATHLFYSPQDPILKRDFVELILHYRMERLVENL